jgi:hypothetical protein
MAEARRRPCKDDQGELATADGCTGTSEGRAGSSIGVQFARFISASRGADRYQASDWIAGRKC